MAGADKPLSTRQQAFVREYLISLNASDAYRRAGYAAKSANVDGPKLLSNPRIQAVIKAETEKRFEQLRLKADDILLRAETILTADARELTSHHIGACRYCYGIDHQFQWKTEREFSDALTAARLKLPKKPTKDHLAALPRNDGGYGYSLKRDPNHDCPECSGLGVPYTRFADTRTISPAAAVLFEGVEETKDGLKIRMASREAAMNLLARHHGLTREREQTPLEDALTALLKQVQGTALPLAPQSQKGPE